MSNLSDFLFPKATEQQAKDGTSNSVLMTPSTTMAALGAAVGSQTFTSSGTFNKPANARFLMVECIGAGGSGGTAAPNQGGAGGGGGGYASKVFNINELTFPVAVTVGSGGAPVGGTGVGSLLPGLDGGDSKFGSYVTGPGGKGGGGGTEGAKKIGGASGSLAQADEPGYFGGGGGSSGGGTTSAPGGDAIYGGGGGAGSSPTLPETPGGTSVYGGNGGHSGQATTTPETTAGAGQAPGGGGGGMVKYPSGTGYSGAGARGEVRVYWW